jgi:hypothetical protein
VILQASALLVVSVGAGRLRNSSGSPENTTALFTNPFQIHRFCLACSLVCMQTRARSAEPMQRQTAPFSKITTDSPILEHAELMFKRFSTEMPSEAVAGAATSHQIPGAHGNVGSRAEESVRGVRAVNSGIRGRIAVRKRFRNRRGPLSTRISEPVILKSQQGPVATLPGKTDRTGVFASRQSTPIDLPCRGSPSCHCSKLKPKPTS